MRETKVNLKHLLEDIRDSYTVPLEEIILVELIANALDSGASRISFLIDRENKTFTVVDNGKGMKRDILADYHNIATTTKIRGKGIGFAGVGAKLSLLIADYVITEAKGGYGSRCATKWWLKSDTSAPWQFTTFSGKVNSPRGVAVSIILRDSAFPLLSEEFLFQKIYQHFYPLFHPQLFQLILKHIYKKGVEFFINGQKVSFTYSHSFNPKMFQIKIGQGRYKKLAGVGYLSKGDNIDHLLGMGLAVSTYGKVIKSGWEWLGINPSRENNIVGVVEIPELASILTTSKMDFLKDAKSLKKYYSFRKAIQQAVTPLLAEMGEEVNHLAEQKIFCSLANEIERALRYVLGDFPELVPLLGIRHLKKLGLGLEPVIGSLISITTGNPAQEDASTEEQENASNKQSSDNQPKNPSAISAKKSKKSSKGPALSIGFEKREQGDGMARMMESKIWINSSHPAYQRVKKTKQEPYHIVFCVALALSDFLEDNSSPHKFIDDFLASWGRGEQKTNRLLEI